MVSKSKLYAQLDRLEEDLAARIVPHLQHAAAGENDRVFCSTDFSSLTHPNLKPDPETDSLIQIGRQILVLREKLGESSSGSIAEQICWYCRQWAAGRDRPQRTAQVLSAAFIEEIGLASR